MPVDQSNDDNRADKDSTKESKYPYNEVYQTKGGVRFIIGNEKGKESIKMFHPSGSFVEYFPEGKVVSMFIGENKTYNKGGVTLTVDENHDVHIRGHSKLQVGGGSHIEVQGDAGVIVGGDVALSGLGNIGLNAKGNLYMGVKGNMNMNVEGNMKMEVKGTTTTLSEGNMTMATKGDMSQSSSGNMGLNSGGNLTKSASGGNYDSGSTVHHNSGGTPTTQTTADNYSTYSDSQKDLATLGQG